MNCKLKELLDDHVGVNFSWNGKTWKVFILLIIVYIATFILACVMWDKILSLL
jgi:hypothetical protein